MLLCQGAHARAAGSAANLQQEALQAVSFLLPLGILDRMLLRTMFCAVTECFL